MKDERKSSCEYCNGNGVNLPIDTFASMEQPEEIVIEGEGEDNPSISVLIDGVWVYIHAEFCPKCGRRLGANGGC